MSGMKTNGKKLYQSAVLILLLQKIFSGQPRKLWLMTEALMVKRDLSPQDTSAAGFILGPLQNEEILYEL